MVRQLPKILGHQKSRDLFFDRGAKEALKVLDSPNVEKALEELSLADLCRATQRAIDNLQYNKFREMQNNGSDDDRLAVLDLKDTFLQLISDLENE